MTKKSGKLMLSIIIMAALLAGLVGSVNFISPVLSAETETEEQITPESDQITQEDIYMGGIFADIAEEVQPSVVKVTTRFERDVQPRFPFDDPFFEDFFRDQFPPREREREQREGYGSGFIVTEDGLIVTNEHVIHRAEEIEVNIIGFEDPIPAEVRWAEEEFDLAILQVDVDEDLPVLPLGDSDQIRPGDWAIAIGNPFGFEHTVTTGVISALGRPINITTQEGEIRTYRNLIQTDAAINPGNSGGPLLNIHGEAVGINTAVSTRGQGIGFAIPINAVKGYVDELVEKGEIIRPWLGVMYQPVTEAIAEQMNLPDTRGALVRDVVPNSPADEAGLKVYDVIIEINREPIEEAYELSDKVNKLEIGEQIMIRVLRDGESHVLTATIGERPEEF